MTEIEAMQSQPTPRDEATVRRLAARFDSIWGFAAYGFLWFFAAGAATIAAMVPVGRLAAAHPRTWIGGAFDWLALGTFVLMWVPFGLWAHRRRVRARRLFREGTLIDGVVAGVFSGGRLARITLRVELGGHARTIRVGFPPPAPDIPHGAIVPVLVVAGYRYGAAFVRPNHPVAVGL